MRAHVPPPPPPPFLTSFTPTPLPPAPAGGCDYDCVPGRAPTLARPLLFLYVQRTWVSRGQPPGPVSAWRRRWESPGSVAHTSLGLLGSVPPGVPGPRVWQHTAAHPGCFPPREKQSRLWCTGGGCGPWAFPSPLPPCARWCQCHCVARAAALGRGVALPRARRGQGQLLAEGVRPGACHCGHPQEEAVHDGSVRPLPPSPPPPPHPTPPLPRLSPCVGLYSEVWGIQHIWQARAGVDARASFLLHCVLRYCASFRQVPWHRGQGRLRLQGRQQAAALAGAVGDSPHPPPPNPQQIDGSAEYRPARRLDHPLRATAPTALAVPPPPPNTNTRSVPPPAPSSRSVRAREGGSMPGSSPQLCCCWWWWWWL